MVKPLKFLGINFDADVLLHTNLTSMIKCEALTICLVDHNKEHCFKLLKRINQEFLKSLTLRYFVQLPQTLITLPQLTENFNNLNTLNI